MKLLNIKIVIYITVLFLSIPATAQKTDTLLLEQLLRSNAHLFDTILKDPGKKEVQILYTRITRDKKNKPSFAYYSYRLNPQRYFYPASTVKLPTAIFALEKINELGIAGLTKETAMLTDSAFPNQTSVIKDSSSKSGLPSIEHYIKKILLVSDNDAYNRVYEFVGRERINQRLKAFGLKHSRINGRLAVGDKGASKRYTNPVRFTNNGQLLYQQPLQYDRLEYTIQLENTLQGHAYVDGKDSLVRQPFDFSDMNVYSLYDQQMILRRLLFPESFHKKQRFRLTSNDYNFLYRYMSMLPGESKVPAYNLSEYYPAYGKFLYYGSDSNAVINPSIRIFNKYGDSYGYIIDNAYIVDFDHNVEFLLSAVVQSNNDGVFNDDKYEYETVCKPFLKNLGRIIYELELTRQPTYVPNLSRFKLAY
ncbi:MAG: serine hydrolase [Chitinophagaceae bacterium]|nr:serine hydrolase [Chitinophagaceae bacterium]